MDYRPWFDILILAIAAGFVIGDIGAFLDGTSYGRETNLPWGVTFENAIVKYAVPIHPTQLYAFVYDALIAVFLLGLYRTKRKDLNGLIAQYGVFWYASFRFLEEFFRGDDVPTILGARLPHVMALIIASIIGYRLFHKQKEDLKTRLSAALHSIRQP